MVPLLFFQAVFVIWPFLLLKSLHPRQLQTLAALQMYFKQCHEPPSEKTRWRSLMFGWNTSFAPFTIRFPGRYHCSLLKSFADWPNRTRLPCVIYLCNSVCQAPRGSSIMMFSMFSLARATCRGALAISNTFNKNCDRMESSWDLYPMIRRMEEEKKRKQRCRRRLLKSAPSQCERVWARACAFARLLLHSSPLWEGWSSGVSLHQLLGDHVLMWVFWSFVARREALFLRSGFLRCCELCTFPLLGTVAPWHRGTWCNFLSAIVVSPGATSVRAIVVSASGKPRWWGSWKKLTGWGFIRQITRQIPAAAMVTRDTGHHWPKHLTHASAPKRWAGERVHSATLTNKFQGWMERYQKHVFFLKVDSDFLSWRPDFGKKTRYCYFLIGAIDSRKRPCIFFFIPGKMQAVQVVMIWWKFRNQHLGSFFFGILAARISSSGRSCASPATFPSRGKKLLRTRRRGVMFLDTEAMAHARLNNQERFGEGGLGGHKMARFHYIDPDLWCSDVWIVTYYMIWKNGHMNKGKWLGKYSCPRDPSWVMGCRNVDNPIPASLFFP